MRLLSRKQVKEGLHKTEQQDKVLLADLETAVNAKHKELNSLNSQVTEAKVNGQIELLRVTEFFNTETARLLNEVAALEARKLEALKPLTDKEQQLDKRAADLDLTQSQLERQESFIKQEQASLKDKEQLLERRLTELSVKEQSISRIVSWAETLKNEALVDRNQATEILTRAQLLSNAKQAEWDEKFKALHDKEKAIDSFAHANHLSRIQIEKDLKLVASRQATLKLAFDEWKRNETKTEYQS